MIDPIPQAELDEIVATVSRAFAADLEKIMAKRGRAERHPKVHQDTCGTGRRVPRSRHLDEMDGARS